MALIDELKEFGFEKSRSRRPKLQNWWDFRHPGSNEHFYFFGKCEADVKAPVEIRRHGKFEDPVIFEISSVEDFKKHYNELLNDKIAMLKTRYLI